MSEVERRAEHLEISAVSDFAMSMRGALRRNSHKGHWGKCDAGWVFGRLIDEVVELGTALEDPSGLGDCGDPANESADVGNFAMMLHDLANNGGRRRALTPDRAAYAREGMRNLRAAAVAFGHAGGGAA